MPSPSPTSFPPAMAIKNRFLGFLIWQFISSTFIFLFFKTFISTISSATSFSSHSSSPTPASGSGSRNLFLILSPWIIGFFTFLNFQLSQLLFSTSVFLLSSPRLDRPASPLELFSGLVRFIVIPGGGVGSSGPASLDFRRRAKVSLSFLLFGAAAGISGLVAVTSVCWVKTNEINGWWLIERVAFRGFLVGLPYASFYVYNKRWILEFPIVQRPPFFSFKMGIPSAISLALKFSGVAYLFSAAVVVFLWDWFESRVTVRKFISQEIILFVGIFSVFLCWELSHHLHQVLQTKRFTFAPTKGSAAAETNPSEHLLAALEESNPKSLLQYLAYLDLCMVCENNVNTWRRAAFFEETGETYKRVITVSLRPLEQLASKLGEGLDNSFDKTFQVSKQLMSPTDSQIDSKHSEPLNNFQLYAWCARTVASLTAHSHEEDRFGVAQLSGSNAAVISALLSCLLAVETLMGKKTSIQSSNQPFGPAGIKWATSSTVRIDAPVSKKKGGPTYSKAYSIADILRTSIYLIVSAFYDEMLSSAKAGVLEKDWIISARRSVEFIVEGPNSGEENARTRFVSAMENYEDGFGTPTSI